MLSFLVFLIILLKAIDAQQLTGDDCKCRLPDYPRIIGGDEAGIIPWQISLARSGSHTCGGTIINHQFIMTAAHCVVSAQPDELTVRVGLHKLNDPNIDAKSFRVKKITVHSRYYNRHSTSDPGDIAILEIVGSIQFSKYIQPACLPQKFENYDDQVGSLLASGWGSITRTIQLPSGQLANAKISNVLKEAQFNYINPRSRNLIEVLGIDPNSVQPECSQNHLICIKPIKSGESVCNGDSGGPIMHIKSGIATVIGIASYVLGANTSDGYVVYCTGDGAYSRASSYLTFIGNHVGKSNFCQF